jgi:hypothetical protein
MTQTTASSELLIRQEIWSNDLKETLHDDLMAQNWVQWLTEFPDGETFTIPSVGDAQVDDYVEDTALLYRPLDTGEFQFTIDEYISSGTYVTKKNEQDSFYMNRLMSEFVPKQRRAIMEHFETTLFQSAEDNFSANAQGIINGAPHRFAGGNSGRIELADFAYAMYALKKANVPQRNFTAIVDPSVEYILNTLTNLTSVSDNPRWEGIVADGIASDMRFVKNVYGFDVYVSNYLPDVTDSALPERDTSTTKDYSADTGKANFFFAAESDILPWMAAWRQEPQVDMEWDMDYQRTKIATTARYGKKLYRPENLVTVVSDIDVA